MLIGELAERTGTSARMLRYYEQQHLLAAGRSANGYRQFGPDDVTRVARIRALLESGLPTRFVRALLDMGSGPGEQPVEGWTASCTATFADQLRAELERIDERLRCLALSRDTVRHYLGAVSVTDVAS